MTAGNPKARELGEAQIEEIRYFRSWGWDDRRIAVRLGIKWDSFTQFMRRHPELGPVNDPEGEERKRWIEFQRAINTHESNRRRDSHGVPHNIRR